MALVQFRVWCLSLLLAGLVLLPGLQAQESDPAAAYNATIQAIQAEEWDKGLEVIDGLFSAWGGAEAGKEEFGPVFGHFFYLQGLLLFGKKDYEGAVTAFERCYEGFPNDSLKTEAGKSTAKQPNRFRIHSLVQWAGIRMLQERYAEARDLFAKALEEGGDSGINRVYAAVNLGRCYLKAGDTQKGYDYIARVLDSDRASRTLQQTIFMILCEDWAPRVTSEEVMTFLETYRYIVDEDDVLTRLERNSRFHYLSQLALSENQPVLSLAWSSMMAQPGEYRDELASRLSGVTAEAERQQIQERINDELAPWKEESWPILDGVGAAHFSMNNFRGSYAVFRHLTDHAPDYEKRPVTLHNAVASGVQIGNWRDAWDVSKMFFLEFPEHDLKGSVARMLVEVIFVQGEYEEAYRIAKDVRGSEEVGSEIRDVLDFIVGASAFHLERFQEARTELTDYLTNYADGKRREPALFYQGAALVKLFEWQEAANAFDQFLELYPQSALTSGVLYQNGLSHFMLDDLEAANSNVDRLLEEFPEAAEIPSAWNLKGDLFVSSGEATFEEIEYAYTQALELTQARGADPETAAYALWQLVANGNDVEAWEQIGDWYDQFQARHEGSVFRLDMLAAALNGLVEMERKDEALGRLRGVIQEFGDQPESESLAQMFGTYLDYLRSNYEPVAGLEELSALLQGVLPKALEGWVRMGKVEILESLEETEQQAVNEQFYALQVGFEPADHSNFVTVRLARWINDFRNKPEDARPLYNFILNERAGTNGFEFALTDVAALQAKSEDPEERAQGRARFEQVLREVTDEELLELATAGIARIYTSDEDYEMALEWWGRYLEKRSWNSARAEANYNMAYSSEKLGNVNDALKIYVSVYANFPGHLDWSTRAYLRTAAILKGAGEDLKALLVLRDMITRMGHLDHVGVTEGKKLFTKWKAEYVPEPEEKKKS